MCVFIFFMYFIESKNEFNILMHKYLKDRLKLCCIFYENVEHVFTYILGTNNWFIKALELG